MYAIQTDDLSRDFGPIKAVDHLTFSVPQGIIFGFLGPNGAGKTTTINLLLGLLSPSKGSATVLGFDSISQAQLVRDNAGVLFEESGLYERLSVKDNLEFFARIWRLPAEIRQLRIRQLLNRFALWDRRDDIASNLSRGMKRKLAVARALVHQPRLLFLDEPTSGLDPIAAAQLHNDLLSLIDAEKVTIFLTTHNLPEAEKICSQVAVINDGRLLAQGNINQLRDKAGSLQIEVIGSNLNDAVLSSLNAFEGLQIIKSNPSELLLEIDGDIDPSSLSQIIIDSGGRIEEFRRIGSSLEDVFMRILGEDNDR